MINEGKAKFAIHVVWKKVLNILTTIIQNLNVVIVMNV